MVVHEKPCVYICFHHDLARKVHPSDSVKHPVVGFLEKADERWRQILVNLAIDIGRIVLVGVSVRRDEHAFFYLCAVTAAAFKTAFKQVARVHADIFEAERATAARTAEQVKHGKRYASGCGLRWKALVKVADFAFDAARYLVKLMAFALDFGQFAIIDSLEIRHILWCDDARNSVKR